MSRKLLADRIAGKLNAVENSSQWNVQRVVNDTMLKEFGFLVLVTTRKDSHVLLANAPKYDRGEEDKLTYWLISSLGITLYNDIVFEFLREEVFPLLDMERVSGIRSGGE